MSEPTQCWMPSSEYTPYQLAHIQAWEPERWKVNDDALGFVLESDHRLELESEVTDGRQWTTAVYRCPCGYETSLRFHRNPGRASK